MFVKREPECNNTIWQLVLSVLSMQAAFLARLFLKSFFPFGDSHMHRKFVMSAALSGALMLAAAGAQAQASFSTLSNASATPLSSEQMAQVEGKAHIYFLVESRGVELPARAEQATRAAAPTPRGGNFMRSPSREATAFNFLN